jgi:hypothetical protein
MANQKLYRVKLDQNSRYQPNQIKDGYLARDGMVIMEYTRGIAIKKARTFNGKIEKAPDKVVKKVSYKLWITVEKFTEFTDGTEEYEDIKMEDAFPLCRTGEITNLEEAYLRAQEISDNAAPGSV